MPRPWLSSAARYGPGCSTVASTVRPCRRTRSRSTVSPTTSPPDPEPAPRSTLRSSQRRPLRSPRRSSRSTTIRKPCFEVTDLDRLETPSGPELWSKGIRRLSLKLAQEVDKDLGTDLTATANFASDQTLATLGSAGSVFITPGGVATGTDASKLVRQMIDAASLHYAENDLDMGEIEGGNISPFFAVIPYKLMNILKNDMIDSGYQDDGMAARAAWMNSILGTQAYGGRLFGIDVFATNSTPQGTASPDVNWPMFFGCRQAIDIAIRSMRMNINLATTRETGGWKDTYRERCDYGHVVTNTKLWLKGSIHQN